MSPPGVGRQYPLSLSICRRVRLGLAFSHGGPVCQAAFFMAPKMTRILDIGTVAHLINGTPAKDLPFFLRNVEHVSRLAMISTSQLLEIKIGAKRGRTLMRQISMELRRAYEQGLIADCPAARYDASGTKLTEEDFRMIMARFTLMERKLILFSLATKMDIVEASAIKRSEIRALAKEQAWPEKTLTLVSSITPHLQTTFLFWQLNAKGTVEPMLSFGSRFYITTKLHWPVFASLAIQLA